MPRPPTGKYRLSPCELVSEFFRVACRRSSALDNPLVGESAAASRASSRAASPVCRISSSLASSIITNHDTHPLPTETSSLEMLQKRAEEVLDSASHNFIEQLSFRADDDASSSNNPDEASNKHRCRYCGKVFGSFSALQIHLRSHTGERPFKCDFCPSSFTTKGNLKVHYQRHTQVPLPFDMVIERKPLALKEEVDAKLKAADEVAPMPPESPDEAKEVEPGASTQQLVGGEGSKPHKKAWETFIEIANAPKAAELESITERNELHGSESNKCPVCQRTLSCRSALRQHYRTHTGERPFRCRLCSRAFTTKGNLKTHISVHKLKPFLASLHKCPLCHRRYSSASVLQQHINTHTGEPIEMTIDQIRASEVREHVSRPGTLDSLSDLDNSLDSESRQAATEDGRHSMASDGSSHAHREAESEAARPASSNGGSPALSVRNFAQFNALEPRPEQLQFPSLMAAAALPPLQHFLDGKFGSVLPVSPFGPMSFAGELSHPHLLRTSLMSVFAGIRGNTTCNICLKTFACNSALEIHYRSHTKERPFKCTICERGFSTKVKGQIVRKL